MTPAVGTVDRSAQYHQLLPNTVTGTPVTVGPTTGPPLPSTCPVGTAEGGYTALHWAACHNLPDMVLALLMQGADTCAQDFFGSTPLHWAAGRGHLEIAKLLLASPGESSAHIADADGQTPLLVAAVRGNWPLVRLMLEKAGSVSWRVDVNARDRRGRTALHYAAMAQDAPAVQMLLAAPRIVADFADIHGSTPLAHALHGGDMATVQPLAAAVGARVVVQDSKGRWKPVRTSPKQHKNRNTDANKSRAGRHSQVRTQPVGRDDACGSLALLLCCFGGMCVM